MSRTLIRACHRIVRKATEAQLLDCDVSQLTLAMRTVVGRYELLAFECRLCFDVPIRYLPSTVLASNGHSGNFAYGGSSRLKAVLLDEIDLLTATRTRRVLVSAQFGNVPCPAADRTLYWIGLRHLANTHHSQRKTSVPVRPSESGTSSLALIL
jgi:hypothetical protein